MIFCLLGGLAAHERATMRWSTRLFDCLLLLLPEPSIVTATPLPSIVPPYFRLIFHKAIMSGALTVYDIFLVRRLRQISYSTSFRLLAKRSSLLAALLSALPARRRNQLGSSGGCLQIFLRLNFGCSIEFLAFCFHTDPYTCFELCNASYILHRTIMTV